MVFLAKTRGIRQNRMQGGPKGRWIAPWLCADAAWRATFQAFRAVTAIFPAPLDFPSRVPSLPLPSTMIQAGILAIIAFEVRMSLVTLLNFPRFGFPGLPRRCDARRINGWRGKVLLNTEYSKDILSESVIIALYQRPHHSILLLSPVQHYCHQYATA